MTLEERNELILKWRFLPRYLVKRLWAYPAVRRIGAEEAEAMGLLALVQAATAFDSSKGDTFKKYACYYIAFRMRDWAMELAEAIHIPKRYRESKFKAHPYALQAAALGKMQSLSYVQVEAKEELDDARLQMVLAARSKLNYRMKYVVDQRLAGRTHADIGRELGVSCSRAEQIYKKAVHKLRRYCNVQGEDYHQGTHRS